MKITSLVQRSDPGGYVCFQGLIIPRNRQIVLLLGLNSLSATQLIIFKSLDQVDIGVDKLLLVLFHVDFLRKNEFAIHNVIRNKNLPFSTVQV